MFIGLFRKTNGTEERKVQNEKSNIGTIAPMPSEQPGNPRCSC